MDKVILEGVGAGKSQSSHVGGLEPHLSWVGLRFRVDILSEKRRSIRLGW